MCVCVCLKITKNKSENRGTKTLSDPNESIQQKA